MEHTDIDVREAAGVRKMVYQQMAREAIDSVKETREHENPERVEAPPIVEVRERREPEGREVRVNAPVETHLRTSAKPKVEFDKPMPANASFADLFDIPDEQRGLSLGKHLRGVITGNWKDADGEYELYQQRVMSGASAGAGGDMLPVVYSSQIIDIARQRTTVVRAGARILPMSNRSVVIPMWTGDPTVSWRLENGNVATSDATVSKRTFVAKSLAGYSTLSREIIADTDLSDLLAQAYGAAVAAEWDRVALIGTGVDPQPVGVKVNTAITNKAAIVTNGASPTWDYMMEPVYSLRALNETPNAIIYHPRNELALAKLRDGTSGVYLTPPPYLDGVSRLASNQLPVNETEGTSGTVCNSMAVADWSQLYLGVRADFSVNIYEQPAATTGQILLVVHFRGDCQIGRGSAFAIRTGLKA